MLDFSSSGAGGGVAVVGSDARWDFGLREVRRVLSAPSISIKPGRCLRRVDLRRSGAPCLQPPSAPVADREKQCENGEEKSDPAF